MGASIGDLFGHLCSGTVFTHDREMKMIAGPRMSPDKQKPADESQIVTSSKESSIEPCSLQDEGTKVTDVREVLVNSDLHSKKRDEIDRPRKRQRISSALSGEKGDKGLHPRKKRLDDFQQHFQKHENAVESRCEAQTEFIELSNKDIPNTHEIGVFLREEMPKATGLINPAAQGSCSSQETQLSLSDVAFESQFSQRSTAGTEAAKTQRRKEAYRATKKLDGSWGGNPGLASTFDDYGNREFEF